MKSGGHEIPGSCGNCADPDLMFKNGKYLYILYVYVHIFLETFARIQVLADG